VHQRDNGAIPEADGDLLLIRKGVSQQHLHRQDPGAEVEGTIKVAHPNAWRLHDANWLRHSGASLVVDSRLPLRPGGLGDWGSAHVKCGLNRPHAGSLMLAARRVASPFGRLPEDPVPPPA
jgi:hypothetical protein